MGSIPVNRFLSIDSYRLEPVDMVDMGLEIERAAEVCSLARLDHLRIEGRRAVEFIAFVCGRCWCTISREETQKAKLRRSTVNG